MANSEMKLSLVLTGRDDGARRLLEQAQRETERLKKMQLSRGQQNVFNQRYATLGIRSEQAIRNEIAQTILVYQRLQKSGRASHNDLARAATATRNKIRELNNELNQGVQTQSKWGSALGKVGKFGAVTAAGGIAAYSALKPAMDNQKQLQSNMNQVARNAWTADADKSPEWIAKQGVTEVRALAESWIKQSGGTADAALGFMNAQMAQGLSFDEIKADKGRGYAGMTAMAQNGQYDFDGAASLYSVFKNAGLSGDKISRAVEKTIQSGLDGKFEIADVVREAPALLSSMGKAGMTADKDLDYMLAWMQSSANKAGSNSEAANNISNTIAKASSSDLATKLRKHFDIDWKQEALKGQGNGENSVQILARLLNERLAGDKEYQKYKQKADKGDAQAAIQADTIRAMMVSKVMPDLQAQSGLMAAMDIEQMQKYQQSTQETGNNKIDRINQARMLDMGTQQERDQSLALLRQDALTNPLNQLETKFAALTAEFPNATVALQALAAAASAAALAQGAMGLLGKGGGLLGGAAGSAGRGALLGTVGRFGVVGAAAAVGGIGLMDATERVNRNDGKGFFEGGLNSKAAGYVESAGSGAIAGAAIGSIVPVVGTAVGAIGGAVLGLVSTAVADWWNSDKPEQVPEPPRPAAPVKPIAPVSATVPSAPQPSVLQTLANKPVAASVTPTPLLMTANASQNHAKPSELPEKLTPVITQQTTTYQTALSEQTSSFQAALQADTAAVSGKLDAINGTLSGLQQTIQLNTQLNLDGRIIANEVSRHAVAMFGRGAGQ